MEHSAVADRVVEAAARNLSYTYLELGRSTPGANLWQERGFQGCTGSLDHPICNFATDVAPDDEVAERLRQIARKRRRFTVYMLPPLGSLAQSEPLERKGFVLSHTLRMMVSEDVSEDSLDLTGAEPADRKRVADFMVDQFFHRQPTSFRHGIAEATARASNLNLFTANWNGRPAGAVMISEHGGIVGLYNLCVAPAVRRRGWGSAIVRTVVDTARKQGRIVTLQCEPSLTSWYSSLGFKEVGSVSVYGLCRFKEIDIMG